VRFPRATRPLSREAASPGDGIGRIIVPVAHSEPSGRWVGRWVGGANVPTTGGWRVNASQPLAELLVGDGGIVLRLRWRFARLAHAETLTATPTDLESVFIIQAKSVLRFRGIGFRRLDGREYYFKTLRGPAILPVLAAHGFRISPTQQRAAKIWRAIP
jgi:hypothetical protein